MTSPEAGASAPARPGDANSEEFRLFRNMTIYAQRIDAALELHSLYEAEGTCNECPRQEWPCATARALGVVQPVMPARNEATR